MKVVQNVLAVLVILGLSAGLAFAKKPPEAGDPKKPKEPEPLVGTLLKVDGQNLTLQTRGGKGSGEVTVVTDNNTQFQVKGKTAAITDLKVGHELVVTPPTGTAQKVVVADEPKKPKKKKDSKK